ncbi:hypothetical protein PG993_006085 [Apiospora rasikravindrae]|uniref:non-specific serine/threonine protein kinase n=1 Tax=Apiospora rasikravindrae TaxID=990691 RepID=A0ABR1TCF8_9PEZI
MDPIDIRIGPLFRPRPDDNPYVQQVAQQGEQRAEDCRQYFSAFSQFTQQKVLSVGGFGAVVKYAQADAQGKHLRYFVVKMPKQLKDEQGGALTIQVFQKEFMWNVRLMGLKHMVQLAWMDQYPIGNQLEPGPWPKGNESFLSGESKWYLMFEYLPHGDLRELIYRLNDSATLAQIPARLMWRIFLCLWPRVTAAEAPVMAQNLQPMPEIVERIRKDTAPVSIVHFDFDPSNVLIGEFRDNIREHALQPVFKLGDYGLTEEITRQTSVAVLKSLQYRGKHGYMAPTMFSLLTKRKPPTIPQFTSRNCTMQEQEAESYGWFLCEPTTPRGAEDIYRKYPRELRELVARCMAAEEPQRPTVVYLLPWIQLHIKEGDDLEARGKSPEGESNADIEKFCREFIVGNPAPPPAAAQNAEDENKEEAEARAVLGDLGGAAGLLRALGRLAGGGLRRENQGDAGYAAAKAQQQQQQP